MGEKMELLAGTLDLIVLRLLQGGRHNGWEITQSIQVVSREALTVKYGSLYPALHRLEARGLIRSEWAVSENNRRAKYYSLTAAGQRELEKERETWERFTSAMSLILGNA
jgi:PadR family transcriptional regulator, regulatory protein PadR